jgi:AcrR family transcriptional regulator
MTQPGSVRPGGRTAQTRTAVYEATLAELVRCGYDQTSVEAIAARAGVHKTTIYRRWRTKHELVASALEAVAESRIEAPDTGDITADLRVLARAVRTTLTSRDGGAAVRAIVSGAQSSAEVQRIARRFWATRLAQMGPIVDRAVERGQFPKGTSAAEVIKYVAAPLYHRLLITAEPLTEAAADLAADAALAAARAGVFAKNTRRRNRPR